MAKMTEPCINEHDKTLYSLHDKTICKVNNITRGVANRTKPWVKWTLYNCVCIVHDRNMC